MSLREYEKHAAKTLPINIFTYYASGSKDVVTLRENITAYNRWVQRSEVGGRSDREESWLRSVLFRQSLTQSY